jgi:MFS family permease
MSYTLSIFIADTSALKNRALMFAFSQSPFIITVWIGGPLATAFLNGPGFRLGFATFAIVTPVVAAPLLALFAWNYRKAKAQGLLKRRNSGRTTAQSIWYYAIEFDIAGILILATGLALFLLPFSLYSFQSEQWRAPLIIAFIVVGGVLLIVFALFEKFVAPKTFIPYELLTDRTVVGGCVLAAVVFVSFYMWDSYFTSFLQVVNGLTVTEASYVANIYSIGSCFFGLIVGAAVRITGRFKWLALYFGIPLFILGAGLMIYFRAPGINVGYLVMCQIFISFAGGTLVICQEMAVMAATSHQYIAVVLALQAMFSSIGGAVGSTVASAIWTAVFPARLDEYLPQELKANATIIYESLTTQLSYEVGTPARDAIIRAYGDAQKDMLIAATAVLAVGVVAVAVWRDIQVKDFKQVKGTVV